MEKRPEGVRVAKRILLPLCMVLARRTVQEGLRTDLGHAVVINRIVWRKKPAALCQARSCKCRWAHQKCKPASASASYTTD
jgi:hypothetical protein